MLVPDWKSNWYLIGKPVSLSLKALMSMSENIMLSSVDAITQPCLTPFVTMSSVSLFFFSESTLTFWDKSRLIKMDIQAIQQNFASIFPAMDRREMPLWFSPT